MNQVFIGGIALIIALILWSSKKQSNGSPFLKSKKDPFPTRTTTTSFVQNKHLIHQKEPKTEKYSISKPLSNQSLLNSIEIKKQLTKLISSNPADRLLAIHIASKWKNKKSLTFLT